MMHMRVYTPETVLSHRIAYQKLIHFIDLNYWALAYPLLDKYKDDKDKGRWKVPFDGAKDGNKFFSFGSVGKRRLDGFLQKAYEITDDKSCLSLLKLMTQQIKSEEGHNFRACLAAALEDNIFSTKGVASEDTVTFYSRGSNEARKTIKQAKAAARPLLGSENSCLSIPIGIGMM